MFRKTNLKDVVSYLENNKLEGEEKTRLISALIGNLNAFPMDEIIKIDHNGSVLANGQELTLEQTVIFRQGVSAIRDSWTFKLIADQIMFEAIKTGVHKGLTTESIMFSKTAIWFIVLFREYLDKFDIHK